MNFISSRGIARSLLACGAVMFLSSTALAQAARDARSVIERVLEKRAERLAGVENYTIVQTVNGAEATLYFERVEVNGVTMFRIVPPEEYQGKALERAGLGGAAGGGPGGGPPSLLEGLPLPGGATLPGGIPLPGLLARLPGMPGAGGAASGGLQQQLLQKGMQGLTGLPASGGDNGVQEALFSVQGLMDLAETGRLDGREAVDGVDTHVLRTDRIQDPELARQLSAGAGFTVRSLVVWIDVDEYLPRRSRVTGEVTIGGRSQELTIEVLESDYRRVEGMLEPFRRLIRMPGMGAALAASDPARAAQIQRDMQQNLARRQEIEKMLAQMPPEQRRLAEAQLGPGFARMQGIAETGLGDGETVIEVVELRVNAGPPTPFGTGTILAEEDASLDMSVVVHVTPAMDESGQHLGWAVQAIGALAGYAGGIVQVTTAGELPGSGELAGNGGASFRWEDGKQATFAAREGGARIVITSNDGRRVAGEFWFEATGGIRSAGGIRQGRTTISGRFEAPIPRAPGTPDG